ncbi:MAG: LysR family transcriptional regulator [Sulfitobacter sp.]
MLDLTQMRYFLAAYEAGSFTRAAELIGVSQPSVSTAIAKLEGQIGERLFERSRAGLMPTVRGDALFNQAAPVLAQLEVLELSFDQGKPQVLRVFCQLDILLGPIARQLAGYLRQHPEVSLIFTDSLLQADLGFVAKECAPTGFGFHALRRESYGVAVAASHPLAARSLLTVDDLTHEPIIGRPYCPDADRYGQSGLPALSAQAQNDHQLLDLVSAGFGIAIVPMGHGAAHSGIKVLPLQGHDRTRVVGLVWRKTAYAASIAKGMYDMLRS